MKSGNNRGALLFLLTFIWIFPFFWSSFGEERTGKNLSCPLEDMFNIYKNIQGQIPLSPLDPPSLPLVKKDRDGRVWAAWEEWGEDRSQIRIGRVQKGRIVSIQNIGRQSGFNFMPEFAFDQNDSPWVIWINYFNQKYRIFVQEVSSRSIWLLNSGSFSAITSPKIIFDRGNIAWAFWNKTEERKGKICYRVFDRREWSSLKIFPQENAFSPLNPDAVVDEQGFLWLTWSRYDGKDYEIYLSRWDGNTWQKEIKITDNDENDSFPSIETGPNNAPLISWTRSSRLGNQICLKSLEADASNQEIRITPLTDQLPLSKIIREGEKIGIIWESRDGIEMKEFSPHQQVEMDSFLSPLSSQHPIYNPSFDENKYICFGDSITYGYMDRLPTPEAGYPPRLDAILDQNFGPSDAINEGIGGEKTINGLSRIDSVISTRAARYILIMEGTNDVINLNMTMDTSAFSLREMIRKCLEAGVFPVIATIIPRRDWIWSSELIRDRHLYLVEQIRQIAADFPVVLVDQYEIFYNYPSSDGGLLSLLSGDLKHPSEKGYQVMAESWFAEIKNFPFPPVDIQFMGRSLEKNSPRVRGKTPFSRQPKRFSSTTRGSFGNLLTWKVNPKIFDKTKIQCYKIYRMSQDVPEGRFRFLALATEPLRFLDSGTAVFGKYIYVISTLKKDGVEGPCSQPIDE